MRALCLWSLTWPYSSSPSSMDRSSHASWFQLPIIIVLQVYLFQRVSYSWPDNDFLPTPEWVSESLSCPMLVKTEKVDELGWQMVDETIFWGHGDVVFSGLLEETDGQALLDWHQVTSDLSVNKGEWESSSMRLLANGLLEVTRKRLLPYLLHPRAQEATSTAVYRPAMTDLYRKL